MKYKTIKDTELKIMQDGMIKVSSRYIGKTVKLHPISAAVLSECMTSKTREQIIRKYGETAGFVFSKLLDSGFIKSEEEADKAFIFSDYESIYSHMAMAADDIRMSLYKKAIFETVREGDVVIDAGAGTGILSIYAAKAGAKKVYAIEGTSMADYIYETAKRNGVADKIEIIKDDFSKVITPEKADIIISEPFGSFVLNEGIMPDFVKCIDNNLKEEGTTIPLGYSLQGATLNSETAAKYFSFTKDTNGIDLSFFDEFITNKALNSVTVTQKGIIEEFVLGCYEIKDDPALHEDTLSIDLLSPFSAVALWFKTLLSKNVVLSTAPYEPETHWKQVILPVKSISYNEKLNIKLSYKLENRRKLIFHITSEDLNQIVEL